MPSQNCNSIGGSTFDNRQSITTATVSYFRFIAMSKIPATATFVSMATPSVYVCALESIPRASPGESQNTQDSKKGWAGTGLHKGEDEVDAETGDGDYSLLADSETFSFQHVPHPQRKVSLETFQLPPQLTQGQQQPSSTTQSLPEPTVIKSEPTSTSTSFEIVRGTHPHRHSISRSVRSTSSLTSSEHQLFDQNIFKMTVEFLRAFFRDFVGSSAHRRYR